MGRRRCNYCTLIDLIAVLKDIKFGQCLEILFFITCGVRSFHARTWQKIKAKKTNEK